VKYHVSYQQGTTCFSAPWSRILFLPFSRCYNYKYYANIYSLSLDIGDSSVVIAAMKNSSEYHFKKRFVKWHIKWK